MDLHPPPPPSVLLGTLSPDARRALLERGQTRSYAPGEALFHQGDEGDFLLVIRKGRVEISVIAANGRRSVLNHMGPGEIVGEVALLDKGTRSANATAATEVTANVLYRAEVTQFLHDNPEIATALIADLCGLIRNASSMFELQSEISARARLARCLVQLGRKWGVPTPDGHVHIREAFSQADLGGFAGLARENVSRHLKAMSNDGLVRFEGNQLTLLDVAKLETFADT